KEIAHHGQHALCREARLAALWEACYLGLPTCVPHAYPPRFPAFCIFTQASSVFCKLRAHSAARIPASTSRRGGAACPIVAKSVYQPSARRAHILVSQPAQRPRLYFKQAGFRVRVLGAPIITCVRDAPASIFSKEDHLMQRWAPCAAAFSLPRPHGAPSSPACLVLCSTQQAVRGEKPCTESYATPTSPACVRQRNTGPRCANFRWECDSRSTALFIAVAQAHISGSTGQFSVRGRHIERMSAFRCPCQPGVRAAFPCHRHPRSRTRYMRRAPSGSLEAWSPVNIKCGRELVRKRCGSKAIYVKDVL
ncbi:hypothetical protein HYPSUDRAFT_1100666, partial [Hypholoma sublateritium FD-334 SS-4]